jgi:signal transduction histidine kinase
MQDQFLANVTHELRSPLTAIKASLATVATDTDIQFSDQQRNMLNIASRNIDRLARLINDILDFAKIAEGRVNVNPKPLDTKTLITETVTSLQSWAQNKKITVNYTPGDKTPRVMGDFDRLTQVLVNLLSNAIKFTPSGGKITVTTESSPLVVKISVTDTGPGIPKKDQEKLFEKFFQLKQTVKMDAPGTGLGLYITKKIVELHQGEIGFNSEEGRGSTFWFSVPIVPESAVREAARAAGVKAAAAPAKKKGWLAKLWGK